jgi:integrase
MGVIVKQRPDKPGWWVFVNHQRRRTKKYFGSNKRLAKEFAEKLEAKLKLGELGMVHETGVKFEMYSQTWLERIQQTRKFSTHQDYEKMLKRDILPAFGDVDLQDITRDRVKGLAFSALKKGQSPKTVQNLIRCLSSLLGHAVEDGLLVVNHALKPGKFLPKVSKRRKINPFTSAEVVTFLAAARMFAPRLYPLFLCAVRTGLRQGELLGLQWVDIDFRGQFIEVQRTYARRRLGTPKNGESRRVDMSDGLAQALKELQVERQLEAVANGWRELPPWVFCNESGGLLDPDNLRNRVFYGILKIAGMRRIRFHDLRHTFASLLLQQGETPVYVKDQMGHSSIQVTVDLYGHLIPGGNRQAVNRLDALPASVSQGDLAPQTHPSTESGPTVSAEAIDSVGAPGRN